MIEVILKREVPKLGERGDVVRVAQGYARNYLFPQQLALPATAAGKQQISEMKAAADRESARLKGDAQKLAGLLKDLTLKIVVRAGDSDQLFGSVTSRDVASEIEKAGYKIDRHKINLNRPIRVLGDHEVSIHLHRDIDVVILVKVRGEGREDEEYVGLLRKKAAEEAANAAAETAAAAEAVASAPATGDDESEESASSEDEEEE